MTPAAAPFPRGRLPPPLLARRRLQRECELYALERCGDAPLGTLAVDDGRGGKDGMPPALAPPPRSRPSGLIRLAVQQSNCFVITSIGNNRTKSRCRRSRPNSATPVNSPAPNSKRTARGNRLLEPSIIIGNDATSQLAAGVGGLFGNVGTLIGGAMPEQNFGGDAEHVRHPFQAYRSPPSPKQLHSHQLRRRSHAGAFGGGVRRVVWSGFSRSPAKATVRRLRGYPTIAMVISLRNLQGTLGVKGGLGRGGQLGRQVKPIRERKACNCRAAFHSFARLRQAPSAAYCS